MIVPIDKRVQIETEMQKLLGLPYVEDSFDPINGGLHCWGFFHWVFTLTANILGIPGLKLPMDIYEAQESFKLLNESDDIRFGDIVVLRGEDISVRHVGFMLDNRWMMHCSKTSNGVARAELTRSPFRLLTKHFGRHKALA